MNVTEAFAELKSTNPGLKTTSPSKMKSELLKAGYVESWSKKIVPKAGANYDGMNTPVVPVSPSHLSPDTEKVLLKQAENPLGDPNKL
jgi:hypothetical protein